MDYRIVGADGGAYLEFQLRDRQNIIRTGARYGTLDSVKDTHRGGLEQAQQAIQEVQTHLGCD